MAFAALFARNEQMAGMSEGFRRLFHRHAAGALERQSHLGRLLGPREWRLDLPGGKIHFGEDLTFAVQILGTEAGTGDRWMWAWSGAISGIPPRMLAACARIHEVGSEVGAPELTEPEVALDEETTMHHLAMVASGLADGDAYFRCPHGPGSVVVMIQDPDFLRMRSVEAERMKAVFEQLLMNFQLDTRAALEGYLGYHGIEPRDDEGRISGALPDGSRVLVELGPAGELVRFDTVGPSAAVAAPKLSLTR